MQGSNTEEQQEEVIFPWSPPHALSKMRTHVDKPHSVQIGHFAPAFERRVPISPTDRRSPLVSAPVSKPQTHWLESINTKTQDTIAYAYGDIQHPLVKQVATRLREWHSINLILNTATQPQAPYPLFYFFTPDGMFEAEQIPRNLRKGSEVSDGNAVLVLIENQHNPVEISSDITSGMNMSSEAHQKPCVLRARIDAQKIQHDDVEQLAIQIAECVDSLVHVIDPSLFSTPEHK